MAALGGTLLSVGTIAAILFTAGRCPARDSGPAHVLARLVTSPALAQDRTRFTRVPAESLADRRGSSAPSAPAPPGEPDVPPVPDPDIEIVRGDRSGDVVRFGSDVHILAGQSVRGDVVAMGGDVTVDGHVNGDVVAMGGDVSLGPSAYVEGQVVTFGGRLHEAPGSRVDGQRVSAGGFGRRWMAWPVMGAVNSSIKIMISFFQMLIMLLIAWGLTQLAPNRTRAALDSLKSEPLMSFGIGLLACALLIPSVVAMALVVIILCITIIGIPLALAVILAYGVAVILLVVWGYVVGAAALGERLSRQLGRTAASLTMMAVWGIVALTAVKIVGHLFGVIPMGGGPGGMLKFLVGVLSAVLTIMGAGALLRTQLRREALAQWWPPGRRGAAPVAPAAPAPAGPAPAWTAPAPPAPPPSPPSSYAPPGSVPPEPPPSAPPPAGV
jgi:hypothetical protein